MHVGLDCAPIGQHHGRHLILLHLSVGLILQLAQGRAHLHFKQLLLDHLSLELLLELSDVTREWSSRERSISLWLSDQANVTDVGILEHVA